MVAAGSSPAGAAVPSGERSVRITETSQQTAYTCFINTTPGCPLPSPAQTSTDEAIASGYGLLDETLVTPIGQAELTSTQSPTRLDMSGRIDLQGTYQIGCVGGPPYCPYPLVVTTHRGSGSSQADIVFRLDEPGQLVLVGSIRIATSSYGHPLGFATPPTGRARIEVGPEAGPLAFELVTLDPSVSPDATYSIDEVIELPAGDHRLHVDMLASVGVELFPGAGGFMGTDMLIEYDLSAETVQGVPIPVPAGSFATRLGLALLLAGSAAGARLGRAAASAGVPRPQARATPSIPRRFPHDTTTR